MIVDTSAILAVLFREADAPRYARKIAETSRCRLSVANLLEASIVIGVRARAADTELDLFVERAEIELVPVSLEHASAARDAWRRFGKGRHPAALNFGDCFAYGLARVAGEPLLFKGEDFALTDIEAA
ncbi:type II toxin-antitoxin system VapC family toxin [Candidatus Palauibacter sp.]|uniref:type II toxin-antitoxin system VapC family toxin n=1 Tax=Candidatus Palauibacter sp. TaxID=3101350 RepID=UPI003AF2BA88